MPEAADACHKVQAYMDGRAISAPLFHAALVTLSTKASALDQIVMAQGLVAELLYVKLVRFDAALWNSCFDVPII